MNLSIASQEMRRKLHRKVIKKIKESEWGTSCKYLWVKLSWNTIHIPYRELARNLFPVESTNNIKIKITHHRVTPDGFILKGISLMDAFAESVSPSLFSQVFNAVSDDTFKKNV